MSDISVVIPCYNEERRVGKTLAHSATYLKRKKHRFEIICVDDGSTDGTRAVITKYAKTHGNVILTKRRKNRGKGYSVRQGALAAKYDLVLFTDADMSTPIEEIEKFLPYAQKYDIVIGARTDMHKLKVRQPKYRELMGRTFSLLKRMIVGLPFRDTQCGFKLFTKRSLFLFEKQKVDRFAFDVELLYLARRHNLRVKEIPVVWINDFQSKVNPVTDSTKMFIDLCKIRMLHKDD